MVFLVKEEGSVFNRCVREASWICSGHCRGDFHVSVGITAGPRRGRLTPSAGCSGAKNCHAFIMDRSNNVVLSVRAFGQKHRYCRIMREGVVAVKSDASLPSNLLGGSFTTCCSGS